jgi:KDO2-lipid IV(A) lauroyltransferase
MTPPFVRERAPAHEALFWRRLAHWGASRGPEWWVKWSPPVFGTLAAALVPSARRSVVRNLRQIRGDAPRLLDARDVVATFSCYASCFAELLSNDAPGGPKVPEVTIENESFALAALAKKRGVVMVTAHTAGWEAVGPALQQHKGLPLMIVMRPEADARAQAIQDEARRRAGVHIAHAGTDPLAALPLLRHLRSGHGVVALQLDRVAPGMRTRKVRLFDQPSEIPEGPLRLAQVSGAPIMPMFCARLGHRRYLLELFESRSVARDATERELDTVAQYMADCMGAFLRRHPTQWFNFGG